MIKALLIDLDGTLVDSVPALYQVYQKFLAYFNKKGTREEFETLIGPSIEEIVAILKEKHALKGTVKELAQMYISHVMMQGMEGTELFPGAKKTLEKAKKKGVKLGLVTSGTKPLVKACLDPLKVTDLFDIVVTSEDVTKAKPHPEMYQFALKKLDVKPNETIAVEDSEKGQEAARSAHINVIRLTHGKNHSASNDSQVTYLSNWNEIGSWLPLE